jgi:hypothetical protein
MTVDELSTRNYLYNALDMILPYFKEMAKEYNPATEKVEISPANMQRIAFCEKALKKVKGENV